MRHAKEIWEDCNGPERGLSCVQIRLVNVCMLRNIYNYDGANCIEPSGALEITTKIQRLI